jgi:hypothetical protein
MLATIFVLGTKVPRSAGCTRSAQAQHGKISFQVTSQASGRSFVVERPRPIYKADRWSPGSRGYQVTRGIASEKAPIFQDKIWVVRSSDAWARSSHVGISTFGSSKGKSPSSSHISEPRTPKCRKHPESGPWFWRLVTKEQAWRRGAKVYHLARRVPKSRERS